MHLFSRIRQQKIKTMLERKTTSHNCLCATLGNSHLIAQCTAKGLQPSSVLNDIWLFKFLYFGIKSLLQVPIASVVAHGVKNTSEMLFLLIPHAAVMSADLCLIQVALNNFALLPVPGHVTDIVS